MFDVNISSFNSYINDLETIIRDLIKSGNILNTSREKWLSAYNLIYKICTSDRFDDINGLFGMVSTISHDYCSQANNNLVDIIANNNINMKRENFQLILNDYLKFHGDFEKFVCFLDKLFSFYNQNFTLNPEIDEMTVLFPYTIIDKLPSVKQKLSEDWFDVVISKFTPFFKTILFQSWSFCNETDQAFDPIFKQLYNKLKKFYNNLDKKTTFDNDFLVPLGVEVEKNLKNKLISHELFGKFYDNKEINSQFINFLKKNFKKDMDIWSNFFDGKMEYTIMVRVLFNCYVIPIQHKFYSYLYESFSIKSKLVDVTNILEMTFNLPEFYNVTLATIKRHIFDKLNEMYSPKKITEFWDVEKLYFELDGNYTKFLSYFDNFSVPQIKEKLRPTLDNALIQYFDQSEHQFSDVITLQAVIFIHIKALNFYKIKKELKTHPPQFFNTLSFVMNKIKNYELFGKMYSQFLAERLIRNYSGPYLEFEKKILECIRGNVDEHGNHMIEFCSSMLREISVTNVPISKFKTNMKQKGDYSYYNLKISVFSLNKLYWPQIDDLEIKYLDCFSKMVDYNKKSICNEKNNVQFLQRLSSCIIKFIIGKKYYFLNCDFYISNILLFMGEKKTATLDCISSGLNMPIGLVKKYINYLCEQQIIVFDLEKTDNDTVYRVNNQFKSEKNTLYLSASNHYNNNIKNLLSFHGIYLKPLILKRFINGKHEETFFIDNKVQERKQSIDKFIEESTFIQCQILDKLKKEKKIKETDLIKYLNNMKKKRDSGIFDIDIYKQNIKDLTKLELIKITGEDIEYIS